MKSDLTRMDKSPNCMDICPMKREEGAGITAVHQEQFVGEPSR